MVNGSDSYRRFLAGDEDALLDLVQTYRPGLRRYLCGIVRDASLADDLVQETFVRLCLKMPRDSGKGSFKTWLYTIGRNIAVDQMRKRSREKTVPIEECFDLSASSLTPEEAFFSGERRRNLWLSMDRLSPPQRQIIYLVYLEGFSVAQAAKILKTSPHNASALLYRAKASLKELMEKEGL